MRASIGIAQWLEHLTADQEVAVSEPLGLSVGKQCLQNEVCIGTKPHDLEIPKIT